VSACSFGSKRSRVARRTSRASYNRGCPSFGGAEDVRWFGIRFGPSSFGIFDAFPDESGREAHLSGQVASALQQNVGELFEEPTIEKVDVIAEDPLPRAGRPGGKG
jgi:hypothetical protein